MSRVPTYATFTDLGAMQVYVMIGQRCLGLGQGYSQQSGLGEGPLRTVPNLGKQPHNGELSASKIKYNSWSYLNRVFWKYERCSMSEAVILASCP